MGFYKLLAMFSGPGMVSTFINPLDSIVLENERLFAKFENPSQQFLKFAPRYLSCHKSDSHNTPAFRSCLVRIPGSYNCKAVVYNNYVADSNAQVRIIKRWNGTRPKVNPLLYEFYIWLVDKKVKSIDQQMKTASKKKHYKSFEYTNGKSISWIEKLLQAPIHDYRKFVVWRILAPYLINVRGLSYKESFEAIRNWLLKCNELRRLDFDINHKIREGLSGASKGYYPIGQDKLRDELPALYNRIGSL